MNRLVTDPRMQPNMNFATLGWGMPVMAPPAMASKIAETTSMPAALEEMDEKVDLKYIIENKPKAKIVREYLRANLASIRSEEDMIFEV